MSKTPRGKVIEMKVACLAAGASGDPRVVTRKGRLRADGTRTEGGDAARLTVYLPPDLAKELDVCAARLTRGRSSIVAEALGAWFSKEGVNR